MIYIIDNGAEYSDHALYFLEAPADFGEWWKSKFLPWQERQPYPYPLQFICGVAESVEWWNGGAQTVDELFMYRSDLDDDDPRPRYRLEKTK